MGRGATARGSSPPPSQPVRVALRPRQQRVGESPVGACGVFSPRDWWCFVDFCLRVEVRASGRASAPSARVAGPRLPRAAVGRRARRARPEGGGREARVCVCVSVCLVWGLPQPSLCPFGRLGACCGDPGARRRLGRSGPPVLRSSWAGLLSSRHPVSRLPPVRPAPFPHASLGVSSGEAGSRRDPRGCTPLAPFLPAQVRLWSRPAVPGSLTLSPSPHPSGRGSVCV